MNCKNILKLFRILFILILCLSLITSSTIAGFASEIKREKLSEKFSDQAGQRASSDEFAAEKPYYASVLAEYKEKGYQDSKGVQIEMNAATASTGNHNSIPLRTGIGGKNAEVLLWEEGYAWFEWNINSPLDALYAMEIEYYPLQGTGGSVQRAIMIDGTLPFREAFNVPMYRMWQDEGEPKVNNIGDEVNPGQVEVRQWQKIWVSDSQGMYAEPFKFYLTKGSHKIRMAFVDQPVAISKMILKSPEKLPFYAEVLSEYKKKGYNHAKEAVTFQAETHTILKTDPTIRREYDGDPLTVPASNGYRKLNVMGSWRWRMGNQAVTWKFDVEEDGLYRLDMKLGQWWNDGLPSYRQIEIDGKVPFEEMKEYKFAYKRYWRLETLADENGRPYLFYLNKGSHTLTMTVKMGPIADIARNLTEDTLLISGIVRSIIMITGNNPDPNYAYELEKSIPGLLDHFGKLAGSMQDKGEKLERISTKRPVMANNLLMIKDQLQDMIKHPDTIARKINDLNNAQSSIGSWILGLQNSPVVIDWFKAGPAGMKTEVAQSNLLQRAYATFKNFILSFSKDYDSVGSVYTGDHSGTTIKVWVARGKEWAEIIKEMADEDFTPKTNININLNVLPPAQLNAGNVNAIMLAIASGEAPDVACGVSTDSPVEFAIRDAVIPLDQFKDYKEVSGRFNPTVMIPYEYRKHDYGLPETMDFNMLFYRTDILNELGLQVPKTWEDIYKKVLPALYKHGMNFYYPHTGYGHFLFQNGGAFYRDNGKQSALDSPEAFKSFKELTDLYTSYGLPIEANFFNRIRTGEMPIGLGGFGLYVQLSVAAPELLGRWDIAPIPGQKRPDGTVDHAMTGISGQASIILNQSKYTAEAWEFIKWWTSSEVQTRFGRELESLMGVEARWNTANIEAFKGLPWNSRNKSVIMQQLEWGRETPVVLGGYFTGRHVNNAWTRVVMDEVNVRDSLEKAVKDINKELKAKNEEYGSDSGSFTESGE